MPGLADRERTLSRLLTVTSELHATLGLNDLLQRLVETAATLLGARYAALGVLDHAGTRLERFITHGLDEEARQALGDPPIGRGILGALIREPRPLRLVELGDDPRSVGFPPGHPPMRSFLGVPILLRGMVFGNLYLTEKADGAAFTEGDEELAVALAAHAAVAIENTRLYESATTWARQLRELAEFGDALAPDLELPELLALLAASARRLVRARLCHVELAVGHGGPLEAASAEGPVGPLLEAAAQARARGATARRATRAERVDSVLDDPELDQRLARGLGVRTALVAPLVVQGAVAGTIALYDREGRDPRFADGDVRVLEALADRASAAIEVGRRVNRTVLQRVLAAQEDERRRLARDLHDETGQALTSILLAIGHIERAGGDGERAAAAEGLRSLVRETLGDVRRLSHELRPAALDDFGLRAALERLGQGIADRSTIDVDVLDRLERRLAPELETALYRVAQEALTNVVKHAAAHRVSVTLHEDAGVVALVVEDDGRGFDPEAPAADSLGLVAMRERIELLDGRLTVASSPGEGTTVRASVPVR
ncbi:MAG: GAF domain-containing protein [Thermoleophilia bacterium]